MSFMYKAKSSVLSFFSDIRFYWLGFVLFGDSHYKVKGPDMRAVLNRLQAGDVLLRRYSHYLGSVLISGHFSHAAIYVGDNKVIHMLGDGVVEEDILTFMRCDDIAVLRCKYPNVIEYAINSARAYKKLGVEYDYDFDASPKRFYCTEFVDNCYDYPVKKETKGKIILPDDFLRCSFFRVVFKK
jgi:hypothetical protein